NTVLALSGLRSLASGPPCGAPASSVTVIVAPAGALFEGMLKVPLIPPPAGSCTGPPACESGTVVAMGVGAGVGDAEAMGSG
ncbi:MAG TPA: hypothetical protein VNJ51_04965, partial [Candidatus Dormibacteraeota bacterium]|nr:hypothetical protein [Candidatus Dormibacteraeota bacterium]